MLVVDLETRSRCDLPSAGAYRYAADISTEILCIGWGLQTPTGWETGVVDSAHYLPTKVLDYLKGDGLVCAFNAQFDRLVWNACTSIPVPLSRWYCVAAQARVNALPGNLRGCTRALFKTDMKDMRGGFLIRQLSVPQQDGTFNNDRVLLNEMLAYCLKDVEATIAVLSHSRKLTVTEHQDWVINETINDDGLLVDLILARMAVAYAEDEKDDLARRLTTLSNGTVTAATQIPKIKGWLTEHASPELLRMCEVWKDGEKKFTVDKRVRANILAACEPGEPLEHEAGDVREMVECLDAGSASSVAKFSNMLHRASADNRVRGAFIYAGASQTLRYASRGLQVHNFRRDSFEAEKADYTRDMMVHSRRLPDTMQTLAKMLRPAILPSPGSLLVVGDWAQIEARSLPWLANDKTAEKRLKAFARGEDIYQLTADQMSQDRQIGKVAELSLGYGGGTGAFQQMARNYGVTVSESSAVGIVSRWRAANSWAENFWNLLERAAMHAVSSPGLDFPAGRVKYVYHPGLIDGTLLCKLPGDIVIQYPRARIEYDDHDRPVVTAMKAAWKPAANELEWPRVRLWRGLLAENANQALCAGVLRATLRALQSYCVVGHVHDEIITEETAAYAEATSEDIKTIMETQLWLPGLPLKADMKIMPRYGK